MGIWRLSALLLLVAGCVDTLDVGRPITLLAVGGWSPDQRHRLSNAAESWNVELGTKLELAPSGEQEVWIRSSDFACAYTSGVTTLDDVQVQICTLDASEPTSLLSVTLHELGHVLNIVGHADNDPNAVMSPESGNDRRFTAVDRELFRQANPDFSPDGGCAVARPLAFSHSKPAAVSTPNGPHLVWGNEQGLHIAALDPATAALRSGEAGIPTPAYPEWIRVAVEADELWISWVEHGTTMYLSHVSLPDLQASAPVKLDVGDHDYQRLLEISTAAADTDIYLALTTAETRPTSHLYRLDRTSGKRRTLLLDALDDVWGFWVRLGGELLLAVRDSEGLAVHSVDRASGSLRDTLRVAQIEGRTSNDTFRAEVVGQALMLVNRKGQDPVAIRRLAPTSSGLAVVRSSHLAPPGIGFSLVSVAGSDETLALALNSIHAEDLGQEAFAIKLDAQTLQPTTTWRRLSAPDLVGSIQPWVVADGARFMVVWRELYDLATMELKSRCF